MQVSCCHVYPCVLQIYPFISDPQEPDKMTMDGVVRLLEDLQLDPGSKLVLLMAWKFQAAAQCEFSHDEFINGMTELGYDVLIKIPLRFFLIEFMLLFQL